MLIVASRCCSSQKARHPRYFQIPPQKGGATHYLKTTVLEELEVRLEQKDTGLQMGWLKDSQVGATRVGTE